MEATTYTVLVTVTHGRQGHSASRIGEIVQLALEQGVEGYAAFPAAQVDVFKGNMIGGGGVNIDHERYSRIIPLHDAAHASRS